jgi:hypothetical protein
MLIKFFHTPKPKEFKYIPHYYDERKERLEQLKQAHSDLNREDAEYNKVLRAKIKRSWSKRSSDAKRERSSSIRLVLILIALLGITYWILMG